MYRIFRYALAFEAVVLGIVYVWSPHGVQAVTRLRQECCEIKALVEHARQDTELLAKEVERWESEPFYKEKIAREQLQMARKDDVVYYVVDVAPKDVVR